MRIVKMDDAFLYEGEDRIMKPLTVMGKLFVSKDSKNFEEDDLPYVMDYDFFLHTDNEEGRTYYWLSFSKNSQTAKS